MWSITQSVNKFKINIIGLPQTVNTKVKKGLLIKAHAVIVKQLTSGHVSDCQEVRSFLFSVSSGHCFPPYF